MIQTLFNFQKAIKTGHWPLHLQTMAAMLPWFHAYDQQNYTRYLILSVHQADT